MAKRKKQEHDFSVTAFRVVQEATGQIEPEPPKPKPAFDAKALELGLRSCPLNSVVKLLGKQHKPDGLVGMIKISLFSADAYGKSIPDLFSSAQELNHCNSLFLQIA